MKNDKHPAHIVITLLMNSMYGKTIIKPVETDTIVKDNKTYFETYMSYNYRYIDSVIEVNGTHYSNKVKSILSHYHYVHCGVEILSRSKIIMNRVFGSEADIDVNIYITRIHILYI